MNRRKGGRHGAMEASPHTCPRLRPMRPNGFKSSKRQDCVVLPSTCVSPHRYASQSLNLDLNDLGHQRWRSCLGWRVSTCTGPRRTAVRAVTSARSPSRDGPDWRASSARVVRRWTPAVPFALHFSWLLPVLESMRPSNRRFLDLRHCSSGGASSGAMSTADPASSALAASLNCRLSMC